MKSRLVPSILGDDHELHTMRNDLGIFPRWEQILTQVQDREVSMMWFTHEEIQHAFVVASFGHETVQDQHAALGRTKPLLKIVDLGNTMMKMNPSTFHAIKPPLPHGVTIMTLSNAASSFEQCAFGQEGFGQ